MSLPDAGFGDAETLERIGRARRSAATEKSLERLEARDLRALLERRAAEGERPYLVYYDEDGSRSELSYGGFLARVAARARTLADAGVGRGDRVATLFPNHPEVPVTCFAAWRLGAIVVPVNLGEDDERVAYVLGNAAPRAAVHAPELEERVRALRERARELPAWLDTGALEEAPPERGAEDALPGPAPEDDALIVYTSGTTGAPKGVVLTQQNLLVDAEALARWNGFDRDVRLMCVLPTHHVNGLVVTLLTPFLAGGSVVLNRRFQTATFWERIARERVHVVSVVPTLLAFLLEEPKGTEGLDLSALRHLICGAGPLTVELGERFESHFGVRILHGYGLSETTCYSSMLPVDLPPAAHRAWMREHGFPSIGVPLPPNEMAIHDRGGRALGPGERGEIVARGVNVMRGYHERPDANRETFAHGWFRSGDEGFFLEDARRRPFFFITGRMKELIIRGGVNLSPFEIDEVLNGIPGVERGLAVGFENDWYGEEVGAYVMREEGAQVDAEAILAACRDRLPFAKAPKVVVFGEDVPVTATGKYQRNRLRSLFAEWKPTQFRPPRKG